MSTETARPEESSKKHHSYSHFNTLLVLMKLTSQKERQMCKQTITPQRDIFSNRRVVPGRHAQAVPRAGGKMRVKVPGKTRKCHAPREGGFSP